MTFKNIYEYYLFKVGVLYGFNDKTNDLKLFEKK